MNTKKNELRHYSSMVDYIKDEDAILASSMNETSIISITNTEVIYESGECCNIEYCVKNNITHVQEKYMAASCIVMKKGIILGVKRDEPIERKTLNSWFMPRFCEFLNKKEGIKAVRDGNDILIDGYKVASSAEGCVNGFRYLGVQISMEQNMDVIEKVCKKPMNKVPKGLKDFGVELGEIIEFCSNFWTEY